MLSSRACRVLLLAMAAIATFARHACADTSSEGFGILNLESVGVSPELGIAVTDALRRQLDQLSGVQVSSQDMVEVKLVFGCVDEKPGCLARAGRQLGVARLIYGKLRPQPDHSDRAVVALYQLNVGLGAIENSFEEAVPLQALSNGSAELDGLSQRWLLRLAGRAPIVRERRRAPPATVRWNRGLWISSAVFGSLAGAAAFAALGTWRGIGGAESEAAAHLDLLQSRLTANGTVQMYRGFFESSDQLSHCAQVPDLIGDQDYENYRSVCQRGNALATATTGLLAAAGGLAFLSVTSLILSGALRKTVPARRATPPRATTPQQSVPARPAPATPPTLWVPEPADIPPEEPPPAGEPKPDLQGLTGVRLDAIAPSIGPNGAAVMIQLRF